MVKLTKDQRALLNLASQGEIDMTWGHSDAEALAATGLLEMTYCRPGSAFIGGQVARITEAGRAALNSTQENP